MENEILITGQSQKGITVCCVHLILVGLGTLVFKED
jgi:hypothetical protein